MTGGNLSPVFVEEDADVTPVRIRTAPRDWAVLLIPAALQLGLAVFWATTVGGQWWPIALIWLVAACVYVAEASWIRTFGVVLTPHIAHVRGVRRRSVPWQDVQAVIRHRRAGTWCVQLIVDSGRPVTLRAPTTYWGIGRAQYDRDFHRIGQWWLSHRGQSWSPTRPEAPRPG